MQVQIIAQKQQELLAKEGGRVVGGLAERDTYKNVFDCAVRIVKKYGIEGAYLGTYSYTEGNP